MKTYRVGQVFYALADYSHHFNHGECVTVVPAEGRLSGEFDGGALCSNGRLTQWLEAEFLSTIKPDTIAEIDGERRRQIDLFGIQRHDFGGWSAIISEEFVEVGKAICDTVFPKPHSNRRDNLTALRTELVQVAAVATAIIEHIDELISDDEGEPPTPLPHDRSVQTPVLEKRSPKLGDLVRIVKYPNNEFIGSVGRVEREPEGLQPYHYVRFISPRSTSIPVYTSEMEVVVDGAEVVTS
jgi:hypothetical protein